MPQGNCVPPVFKKKNDCCGEQTTTRYNKHRTGLTRQHTPTWGFTVGASRAQIMI